MKGLVSLMNKGDVCNRNTLLDASELREHAAQLQHTFEQQWKKRNLWCLHLLKGVSVGFVIQRRILRIFKSNESKSVEGFRNACMCMSLRQCTEVRHLFPCFIAISHKG